VTRDNVHLLWRIMIALGGYFIAGALGLITWAGFYAYGDTRTPTWIVTILYTLYLPLKIFGFLRFGLIGLSLTTSVYMLLNVAVQAALLGRWLPQKEKTTPGQG